MAKSLDNPQTPLANGNTSPGNGGTPAPRRLKRASLSSQVPAPKKKRSIWRKLWLFTQVAMALTVVAVSVLAYFAYQQGIIYYAKAEKFDLKKLDDLNVTSTFYDTNGEELGRIFVEDRVVLKPEQIPDMMRKAVMAAEDRRFYQHGAIDYWGILRALRENFGKKNKVQGGSTIEQQLAKHLIGDFKRTMDRKFLEAFVAVRLERSLTKDQIMNYYLNRIYFGKGYFGVGAAARGYFGKDDAMQLTVPECALLAGIIRAPTSSSPRVDVGKAKWRRDATLKQMLEEKYITHEDYVKYVNTPIHTEPPKASQQTFEMAAAVKEMEQILSIEGTEEMPQGLKVQTNINLRLQRAIEEQMELKLSEIENAAKGPAGPAPLNPALTPAAPPPLQGAALVADLESGRVLAWVGGRDFSKSQFDHVSMAKRENGALLQPIIYSLAFDKLGLHPASMINASFIDSSGTASPADLALGDPNTDLTKRFLSVQDALALGNKAAAVRVGLRLGAPAVEDFFKSAGLEQAHIPTDKPNTFSPDPMSLSDVASLYQILGNDGVKRKLKIIQSIQSKTGETLYDDSKPDQQSGQDQLLNIVDDEQMSLTLQNSVRSGFARTLARDYGFKSSIAGMAGYSEGYRDAWFVGYTPKILAGVWIGYDDSRPIGGKDLVVKSSVPLWGDIMRQVQARMNGGGAFPVPAALTKVEVDRSTGAMRGLAGLAPAPLDIFVYLKKDQVNSATTQAASSPQQVQAPKEWSDWLTTMFNDSDETALPQADAVVPEDKRADVIPSLAEYKMPGLRADIMSSDGIIYATTGSEKNLVLGWPAADQATQDIDLIKWMRGRLGELEQIIGVSITVSDTDLVSQYHTQRYQPFTVLEDVTPLQVAKVQAAGLEAKGFGFQTTPKRSYPRGPELAHVLGYLSRSQQRNRGKYLSGDVIYDRYKGASGIEQVLDSELAGKDGRFMISTTPDGYARSAAVADPATYGHNVRLTIDSKIQAAAEQAMSSSPKKMNAVVIMDVHNGDIVAMASHPTFDPNIFVPAISADEWQMLNTDEKNPLLNRTIHAQYPPGSCFKTVTSIAAMTAGVFDPNWVVHCTGYFDIGNVHMVLKDEHGDITYKDALTHSFNTYFMELGLKVGRDILLDTARSLNLGSPTGVILPGELPGMIPDNEFVKRVHQREFGPGDLANTSIGQGDVLVTPLQMADLMATYANGGTVYRPRLVSQIEDRNGTVLKSTPTETLRTVTLDSPFMANLKEGMINVIDEGTATVVHREDMKIAAKTGTAQVGSKEHRRQIAWLCGYLPADNPQYAFAVVVQGEFSDNHGDNIDDGLLGGRDAGSIAEGIFDSMYGAKGDPNAAHRIKEIEEADKEAASKPAQTKDADDDSAVDKPAAGKTAATDDDDSPVSDKSPAGKTAASTDNADIPAKSNFDSDVTGTPSTRARTPSASSKGDRGSTP